MAVDLYWINRIISDSIKKDVYLWFCCLLLWFLFLKYMEKMRKNILSCWADITHKSIWNTFVFREAGKSIFLICCCCFFSIIYMSIILQILIGFMHTIVRYWISRNHCYQFVDVNFISLQFRFSLNECVIFKINGTEICNYSIKKDEQRINTKHTKKMEFVKCVALPTR